MYYIKVSVARCGNGLGIHLCNSKIPESLNLQEVIEFTKRYQYVACAIQKIPNTFGSFSWFGIVNSERKYVSNKSITAKSLSVSPCLPFVTYFSVRWMTPKVFSGGCYKEYVCLLLQIQKQYYKNVIYNYCSSFRRLPLLPSLPLNFEIEG